MILNGKCASKLIRHCYSVQSVSQPPYFKNRSCMIKDVVLCIVPSNLCRSRFDVETGDYFQIASFFYFFACVAMCKNSLQRCGNRCNM